jgi:thymidylate synthase (FAD)
MKVELLDTMGTDLDVVNAARVSFDKESYWESDDTEPNYLGDRDARLISYLATHGHWTPFSHCYAKFRITAPIFVVRQLFKHKVGLTENEVSRRYVDSKPKFYTPVVWRMKAENVKQGSSDEQLFGYEVITDGRKEWSTPAIEYAEFIEYCDKKYNEAIAGGMCAEQARMFLPLGLMTEWIWSGSVSSFARVYKQRTSEHAQHETRTVAHAIGNELRELFPISWKALTE